MKSTLTVFTALAALALPAGLPALAMAQDSLVSHARPTGDANARFTINEVTASAPSSGRPQIHQVQDRRGGGERGGRGGEGGERRGDRGGDRGDRGGGGWTSGGPRGGDDQGRGGRDRNPTNDNRPREERWNRPDRPVTPPVVAPPTQERDGQWRGGPGRGDQGRGDQGRGDQGRDRPGQGWDRGNDARGRGDSGDRGRDRPGQDWNRGNDGRGRDNGGWNNGGRNNGNWNRDRNGSRHWQSDRSGRRDYGGFQNRWNQNNWRRDWNRGRSYDWWRNDRGFRGYTGFRSGFYFAPNYGYYAVPRNYWGQSWRAGDYLPSIFWRYSLNDYRTYSLGFPPPGTQWVAVDNAIYLIDQYDGYIVEVIRDAWRW